MSASSRRSQLVLGEASSQPEAIAIMAADPDHLLSRADAPGALPLPGCAFCLLAAPALSALSPRLPGAAAAPRVVSWAGAAAGGVALGTRPPRWAQAAGGPLRDRSSPSNKRQKGETGSEWGIRKSNDSIRSQVA